jgi:hypothetical protein
MPKGYPGPGKYGISRIADPVAYEAAKFQAIKADPIRYAERKRRVNAARRRPRAQKKGVVDDRQAFPRND